MQFEKHSHEAAQRAAKTAGVDAPSLEAPNYPHESDSSLREQRRALRAVGRKLIDDTAPAADDALTVVEARMDAIEDALDDAPDPRRPKADGRTVSGGSHVAVADETEVGLRSNQSFVDRITDMGMADTQYRGLDLGRYFRSMVLGASSDVEKRALTEGTDSSGGYTVPTVLSAQLIDLMRAKNQAINAGAVTMPLTSDKHHIAKVASDPVPAWRAENETVTESEPTFANIELVPQSLAVLVKASREVLEDSVNIGRELPGIIAAAMAQEMDRVVFLGSGASNEPAGLDTITGVQELAHDAAITDYAPLVTARKLVMQQNARRATNWVMHPDTEAEFGGLTDSTGQPLRYPNILDRPDPMQLLSTTKLPTDLGTNTNETTIYGGDFSQVVIGLRNDIRIETLRERFATELQYGFIAWMRMDVAAIRPDNLVRVTGVQLS